MFDIGFFELLVIGVVLLIVMGPEKLPEVAKQAAFFVRKARQGLFRMRSEMRGEMEGTPFEDFQQAKREIADLKRDIRQMGSDLADAAEKPESDTKSAKEIEDSSENDVSGSMP